MIRRVYSPLLSRSFFVFGARGTGKTTWLKEFFKNQPVLWIDLLDPKTEAQLFKEPDRLIQMLEKMADTKTRWVVIDEIQKNPALLNIVHSELAGKKRFLFALTGSSARKLKREGVNLLAGRAGWVTFFPPTSEEIGKDFDIDQALQFGTLPELFHLKTNAEKTDYLESYAVTYLKEEILAEQLVRNVPSFRKFIDIAAQMNTKIINYSKLAREALVEPPTIRTYFDILEDTFLGFRLDADASSVRARQTQHPKFYFFDCGIARALQGLANQELVRSTSHYGEQFEQFLILEIFRLNEIYKKKFSLSYLRTKDDAEIDLILRLPKQKPIAVEFKSSTTFDSSRVQKFQAIAESLKPRRMLYLSQDQVPQKIGKVECLPWQQGLKEIFE